MHRAGSLRVPLNVRQTLLTYAIPWLTTLLGPGRFTAGHCGKWLCQGVHASCFVEALLLAHLAGSLRVARRTATATSQVGETWPGSGWMCQAGSLLAPLLLPAPAQGEANRLADIV